MDYLLEPYIFLRHLSRTEDYVPIQRFMHLSLFSLLTEELEAEAQGGKADIVRDQSPEWLQEYGGGEWKTAPIIQGAEIPERAMGWYNPPSPVPGALLPAASTVFLKASQPSKWSHMLGTKCSDMSRQYGTARTLTMIVQKQK